MAARRTLAVKGLRLIHGGSALPMPPLSFSLQAKRYGLVGANGAGKTTLLRALSGVSESTYEFITVDGTLEYLSGSDGGANDFEKALPDSPLIRKIVSRLRSRARGAESGGEKVLLALASIASREPEWLLLDEPTNHLDTVARQSVFELMDAWPRGIVCASHDAEMLAHVDHIIELSPLGLREYGGSYQFYLDTSEAENESARVAVGEARAVVERRKSQLRNFTDRQQKAGAAANRRAKADNDSAVIRKQNVESAESTSSKAGGVHASRLADAKRQLDTARSKEREAVQIVLDLPMTQVPTGKQTVLVRGLNVLLPSGRALWSQEISFTVAGPQRLQISGDNGAGKSLLLRRIAGKDLGLVISGEVIVSVPVAYVDQRLECLPRGVSILEAFRSDGKSQSESECRIRLGRLGFEQDRSLLMMENLSSGERMRAALLLQIMAPVPPQLLVLDEPSNFLDLQTKGHIAQVLRSFRGTIIVSSHDSAFLADLGVKSVIELPIRA